MPRSSLVILITISFALLLCSTAKGQCDTGPGVTLTSVEGHLVAQILGIPPDGPFTFDFVPSPGIQVGTVNAESLAEFGLATAQADGLVVLGTTSAQLIGSAQANSVGPPEFPFTTFGSAGTNMAVFFDVAPGSTARVLATVAYSESPPRVNPVGRSVAGITPVGSPFPVERIEVNTNTEPTACFNIVVPEGSYGLGGDSVADTSLVAGNECSFKVFVFPTAESQCVDSGSQMLSFFGGSGTMGGFDAAIDVALPGDLHLGLDVGFNGQEACPPTAPRSTLISPFDLTFTWNLQLNANLNGLTTLEFGYADELLLDGVDEASLGMFLFENGGWTALSGITDTVTNTIQVQIDLGSTTSLAMGRLGPAEIPATSSVGLWCMAVCLLVVGAWIFHRQQELLRR